MTGEVGMPPGFTLRAPRASDLPGVNALIRVCELADGGQAENTEDDLRSHWQRSGFDLGRDAWLVVREDGTFAGYGGVWQRGGAGFQAEGWVRPDARGRGIGRALVRLTEGRAGELSGGRAAVIDNTVGHADEAARRLLEAEGYSPERYYWQMQIEMASAPEQLPLPQGFRVRTFEPDRDAPAVHALVQETFADNREFVPTGFEDWSGVMLRRESFDPSLFFLAAAGDEIVAAVLCPSYPDTGWVRQVAVRRDWRGRGVARALLTHAFREMYARGQRRVGLVVDSYNLTGAKRVYESLGMRVLRQYDAYRKQLRPT